MRIAIVISITEAEKKVQVEKWCSSPAPRYRPATRANPNPNLPIPIRKQEITITQIPATPQLGTTVQRSAVQPDTAVSYAVTGAPLILEFENLLLRPLELPERDVVLTVRDLSRWANCFWRVSN